MGCSRSAISDDEDDWAYFAREAEINTAKYKVYSIESDYAKKGYKEHGLKGQLLVAYINSKMTLLQATQLDIENIKKLIAANELVNNVA